jgi:hypothetical protein
MLTLKSLIGRHQLTIPAVPTVRHPYDVEAGGIAWEMDGKVYFVFEDQLDGYRSSASPVLCSDGDLYSLAGVWGERKRAVECKLVLSNDSGACEIIEFVDALTGHVWMRVGTDHTDDYYPWFVGEWRPMNESGN